MLTVSRPASCPTAPAAGAGRPVLNPARKPPGTIVLPRFERIWCDSLSARTILSSMDGQYRGPLAPPAPWVGISCRLSRMSWCVAAVVRVGWHSICSRLTCALGSGETPLVLIPGLRLSRGYSCRLSTLAGVPVLSRSVSNPRSTGLSVRPSEGASRRVRRLGFCDDPDLPDRTSRWWAPRLARETPSRRISHASSSLEPTRTSVATPRGSSGWAGAQTQTHLAQYSRLSVCLERPHRGSSAGVEHPFLG